jgi:hypothetical protein
MSKKLKFSINNNEFTLPINSYQESNWGGSVEKYIHMSAKNSATVIKQFVKQNFPQYKVWAVSDTYSGGSSTRIYVCNEDGSSIPTEDYKRIEQWKWILSGGSFNGMEDIYEYREDELTTDNGMALKYFPSYIFIDNKPKWGTVEYWLNEFETFKDNLYNPDYARIVGLVKKTGSFLEYNKTYMTKGEYNQCVKSLKFV